MESVDDARVEDAVTVAVGVGEMVGLLAFEKTLSVLLLKRPRVVERELDVEVEVRRF